MRGARYTPEEDARIAELRSQGYTDGQIAVTLGRPTGSIQSRVHTLRHTLRMRGEGPVIQTRRRPSPLTPGRRDDEPDHTRTALALEEARAALARAQARHREAMEAILGPVREAMHETGLIDLPTDDAEEDAAYRLVDHLRRRGVEMRRVA